MKFLAALALFVGTPALSGAQEAAISTPFTRAQVETGRAVYTRACASCHGARLDDGAAVPVAGAAFLRNWARPDRTLADLFFITSTTMPRNAGGTLSPSEYAAVVAFMLERSGYAAGDQELPTNREQLAGMRVQGAARVAAQARTAPDFIRGDSGIRPTATGPRHQDLLGAASTGRDWLSHTRDYSGSRYSPLAQITSANVAQLRPACVLQVGDAGNFQTGPVVHDGTMYITTNYATIAIDAATCRQKWRHVWQIAAQEIRLVNRGVAIKDGRARSRIPSMMTTSAPSTSTTSMPLV